MTKAQNKPIQKQVASIWSRKADLVYLTFFVIHIVMMLCVDLVGLYPEWLTPSVLLQLRQFYTETYQDKFFTEPALWGTVYLIMEVFYHLPLSIWVIGALINDNPMVPVHLLVWAVQTAVTTITCLADVWGWADRTLDQKTQLTGLYGPYILFAVLLGIDMFRRVSKLVR